MIISILSLKCGSNFIFTVQMKTGEINKRYLNFMLINAYALQVKLLGKDEFYSPGTGKSNSRKILLQCFSQ